MDATSTADRQYFERNPHAQRYFRPLSAAEASTLRNLGAVIDSGAFVGVTALAPGIRHRQFVGVQLP